MPYYSWYGVNIFADIKFGKSFARSYDDLDKMLFARNIAIISCKQIKINSFLNKISQDHVINFFRQLAILLHAGLRLPDALIILCDQSKHIQFRQIVFEIESNVFQGLSFSQALAKHPKLFSAMIIQVIKAGQESGELTRCLYQLSDHLQEQQLFHKQLKSAAVLPLITLAFFCIVVFAIFAFVVPKFIEIFTSMGKELPALTNIILRISIFLRSRLFIYSILGFVIFVFALKKYVTSQRVKKLFEKICISAPMIREFYIQRFLVFFLRSVAMLLKGGVRLVPAIAIARRSISNSEIAKMVHILEQDVYAGSALSQAMVDYGGKLFPQDLIAMVKVGEESALLHIMLERAADMYREKISRSIFFFTTIFQPVLMIILGLLITLLIFAIYVPIFGLANLV